jgi:hypothetical protein
MLGADSMMTRLEKAPPIALFLFSILILAAIGQHYVAGVQATGDEPEYLLMAQSLGKEHDLDLADNWTRGDFRDYVPGMTEMPHGTFRKDGRPISTHSPGLPAFLAPVYAAGGRAACALLLAVLAAVLALEVRTLALRATGDARAAFVAWAAALGPPAVYYSFHVYTEIPSALAAAFALRLLLGTPGAAGAVAAALAVSTLPWLHVKMIPLAAVLGGVALWRLRGRPLARSAARWRSVTSPTTKSCSASPRRSACTGGRSPRAPAGRSHSRPRSGSCSTARMASCPTRRSGSWRSPACRFSCGAWCVSGCRTSSSRRRSSFRS